VAFRAVTVRLVEEFFIVFGNHGPMFPAIYARACRAVEGGPKAFEIVQPGWIDACQAHPKSNVGACGEDHPFLSNETADEDCATVLGKAVGMSGGQDFDNTGSLATERAAKHSSRSRSRRCGVQRHINGYSEAIIIAWYALRLSKGLRKRAWKQRQVMPEST
jgi:hypothetical protein